MQKPPLERSADGIFMNSGSSHAECLEGVCRGMLLRSVRMLCPDKLRPQGVELSELAKTYYQVLCVFSYQNSGPIFLCVRRLEPGQAYERLLREGIAWRLRAQLNTLTHRQIY